MPKTQRIIKVMNCKDFREIADSYLSDELLVETNHDVLRHLETCADCRRELAARRDLRDRLREAVKAAPQSQLQPNFVVKLTNDLRENYFAGQNRWNFASFIGANPVFAGVLAILLLSVSIGLLWQFRQPKNSYKAAKVNPQPTFETNIKTDEKSSLQVLPASFDDAENDAVEDHKNCALKFNLKEKPITLDEAAKKYGGFNKDLDKSVFVPLKETFGDQVKILEVHSCIINGRRFAHVVIKYQEHIVSVLTTKREDGADGANGAETDAISCQTLADLRVACFQTAKFGVFVVSDLNETDNLKIARTIAPSVKKHFEQSKA